MLKFNEFSKKGVPMITSVIKIDYIPLLDTVNTIRVLNAWNDVRMGPA